MQKKAGEGYENYNIQLVLFFGEDESKIEFTELGILLADGSECFIKGWNELSKKCNSFVKNYSR